MSKKRTVEVVLTVEIPDSKDTTNETVATFFNWEICHRVSEETEGDMVVQKIDVREKVESEKCEWSRESDDVWRSDCGLLWEFDNEETPKANNMNYCPQCGKILKEAPEYWEEDEDE